MSYLSVQLIFARFLTAAIPATARENHTIAMKSFLILFVISLCVSTAQGDNQKKTLDKFAAIVAKCDVGYRIVFNESDLIPVRIDFLFADRNAKKTFAAFRNANIERFEANEKTNSRVYFTGKEDGNHFTMSIHEKNGKLRLHDAEKKLGYWVNTDVLVDLAVEMSKGKKKAIR